MDALAGKDVREKQAALQRAREELARLHALKPVKAHEEPVSTRPDFRQQAA